MVRHLPLLLLLAAPAAANDNPAQLLRLAEPAGVAQLLRPDRSNGSPLVILLPDALGADGREEPYRDSLQARGIATLLLGLGEDRELTMDPVDPAASPAAAGIALDWASAHGFGPVGLLGFGLGGRAALAAAGDQSTAALYPGCTALPLPAQAPALILQGADTSADCDGVPTRPGLTLRLLPGAGHAWDAPGAIWPMPGPILPDPAGGGYLRSRVDHVVTLEAAEAIADWFEDHLLAGQRSAAR